MQPVVRRLAAPPAVLMTKDAATSGDDDPYAGLAQRIVVQDWFQELNAPGSPWSDDLTVTTVTHIRC